MNRNVHEIRVISEEKKVDFFLKLHFYYYWTLYATRKSYMVTQDPISQDK